MRGEPSGGEARVEMAGEEVDLPPPQAGHCIDLGAAAGAEEDATEPVEAWGAVSGEAGTDPWQR